jgi:hypothetical protein
MTYHASFPGDGGFMFSVDGETGHCVYLIGGLTLRDSNDSRFTSRPTWGTTSFRNCAPYARATPRDIISGRQLPSHALHPATYYVRIYILF